MLHYNETEIKPDGKIKRKVREYARYGGGIHRMNTEGANFYSFTAFKNNETGKEDFVGGWDWYSTLQDNLFSYVLNMNDGTIKPSTFWQNEHKRQDKLSRRQIINRI